MVLLKEDGSLDIERINRLPIDDYMEVVGGFTEKQYNDFFTKQPINEGKEPVKVILVEDTIEKDAERCGMVNFDEFINKMREKYGLR